MSTTMKEWFSITLANLFHRYERPIFTFFNIGVFSGDISLTPDQFAQLMESFAENNCETISLETYLGQLDLPKRGDRKQMVLTFDDGMLGVYEHAWPILKDYGFHATVFLTTGNMGGHSEWLTDIPGASQLDLMEWKQAEEMAKDPLISFGSHSVFHPDLTQLSPRRTQDEIAISSREIEDRLGVEVGAFSYPFGCHNERIEEEVRKAGYLGACTYEEGIRNRWKNRFSLKRIPVTPQSLERHLQYCFTPLCRMLDG